MTEINPATELKERFVEEQKYIGRYVDFIRHKTAVYERDFSEFDKVFSRYGLARTRERRNFRSWNEPYSFDELNSIMDGLIRSEPSLILAKNDAAQKLASMDEPEGLGMVDARSDQGQSIQFMMDALEGDDSEINIAAARDELLGQFREAGITEIMDYQGHWLPTEDTIDFSVKSALFILKSKELYDLEYVLDKLDELKITLRLLDPNAEINIYRQSFIQLMTIFDATIFDLFRVALRKDFFNLIGVIGKKDRVTLESLGNYHSFDDFRDEVIELQLRQKYLKDLLFFLNDLGVLCVMRSSDDRFIQLIELVLRRNIHIHNRGLVDERYLDKDENSTPRYNIYNFAMNEAAHIDAAYWEMANRLCVNCVGNIVEWIDAL